jgi:hypothetical protein
MKKTKDTINKKSFYSNCEKHCPICGYLLTIKKTITPKSDINEYVCLSCNYHENVLGKKISESPTLTEVVNAYESLASSQIIPPLQKYSSGQIPDMTAMPGASTTFFITEDMINNEQN